VEIWLQFRGWSHKPRKAERGPLPFHANSYQHPRVCSAAWVFRAHGEPFQEGLFKFTCYLQMIQDCLAHVSAAPNYPT
jgi:hypothetical protein